MTVINEIQGFFAISRGGVAYELGISYICIRLLPVCQGEYVATVYRIFTYVFLLSILSIHVGL